VLHEAARAAAGVTLIDGRSADGMVSDANGAQVTLDDASMLVAHLVVAADGGRSRLRQAAGITTIGWPYEQSGIVTVVEPEADHKGCAVQHFLPAGPFALLPMKGNRICVTWTEGTAEARRIMGLDAAAFRHEVERRFGYSLGAIKVLSPPQSWPLELALARRLIAPRLALVGDAAHKLHPIAGQGLNLGLRDVAALAECVIDAARLGLDVGHADVLERFERWRRFDNLTSAVGFDALNRLFSNENTLARSARGAALGLVDRLPAVKAWFVDEAAGARGDVPRLMRCAAA
jgi:2-octaprenyl-6-methoxyphenol hydroxylase